MFRTLRTAVLGLLAIAATAGDPTDIDLVILDNQQRIPGRLEDDPESPDWVLIKTINGSLRLRRTRIASIELGVTSRLKSVKDDDFGGLLAFARWARTKGFHQAALTALDKAFTLVRVDPKRPVDNEGLALYARVTDELQGPEAALPLYRWYRSSGGRNADPMARLDQLEAIVGRSDETGIPSAVALKPIPPPEPERPAPGTITEGLEAKGWLAEAAQYSNPVQPEVTPRIGEDRVSQLRRALSVTFGKGGKDKAAIKRAVNLDATGDHTLSLYVRNTTDQPLRVSIAVKTGNWVFHESLMQVVKPEDGWKELRFDLKAETYKSQASSWANSSPIENLDDVKELQVLLYNKDAEGKAFIGGMRLLSDREL